MAEAICTVTAAGKTHISHFLHPRSCGWWTDVDLPREQYTLLMSVLAQTDESQGIHAIATENELTTSIAEQEKVNEYGKRPQVATAYTNPQEAIRQPTIQPLQVCFKEPTWLKAEITTSLQLIVVDCLINPGQLHPDTHMVQDRSADHISVWKGEARGREQEDYIWRMETVKAHQ